MNFFNLSNPHFYIGIAISLLNGILLSFASGKPLQMLQLSNYKLSGYRSWMQDTKTKFYGKLIMLTFLTLISVFVTSTLLDGFGGYYCYLGLIFYVYFCVVFIINITKIPQKTPLKQTRRMNRLIVTNFVLTSLITFVLIAVMTEFVPFVKYGIVVITPLFIPIVVCIAHLINYPIECLIRQKYLNKARKKLAKMPNLIKIGITGSFGKTTTKHILNVMLSEKYSVCMSPHSFNTPMGLTKVVLKYLKKEHEVLIAEMGARNVGDIKFLCDLIKPKHAIITAVGSQHLSSFGSVENIEKTKFELVESLTDGIAVFNGESKGAMKLFEKCNTEKYFSSFDNENAYCKIKDIQVGTNGSQFVLEIDGKSIECKTNLVGKYILEDIALSACLAYKMGLSLEQIAAATQKLKAMSHRNELIMANGITIIDNSYNSSVESSTASLELLKLFKSENKVVVTPGIVEMGDLEFETNVNFGRKIATVANKVIIVNQTNKDAIMKGLQEGGFDEKNILTSETLDEANKYISSIVPKGSVVLFENDLPDNYT